MLVSLSDCTERAEKLVQQIDSEIGSIAAERDKCLSNCDSYSASVRSATSLNELSRIQRNAPDLTIEGTYIDRNVDSLEQEIKEKKKQLTAFVHFLGELDNAISTKGLSQYKQRITDKISSVDIYSPSSIQEILQLVEQVEREHTYLQEQLRIKQAGEAAEREVSYQIATLKQLKSLYIFCDEFKLLPDLLHIEDAVNFGRSLGIKVFAGLQSIDQLIENYGEARAKNIISGFSSVLSFRANDESTRQFVVGKFGKNYVLEQNISVGNSINEEKRIGNVVEDWELCNLGVGEAVIGLLDIPPFRFKFDLYR